MASLNISTTQSQSLTFSNLFQGVDTKTKHDDKSLRLIHQGKNAADGSEQLRVKVHTSISRLGHGNSRDTKRQEAVALVKTAVLNEFGGNQKLADAVMGHVANDRVSLSDLRAIQDNITILKDAKTQMETLGQELLKSPPDQTKLDATFNAMVATLGTTKMDKGIMTELGVHRFPELTALINQASTGTAQESKDALKTLKTAMEKIGNGRSWVTAQQGTGSPNTPTSVGILLKELFATRYEESQKAHYLANDMNVADALVGGWNATAVSRPANQTATERANFQAQDMANLSQIPLNKWGVSGSGSSGAVLVRDAQVSGGGAALKFSDEQAVQASVDIAKNFNAINAELGLNRQVLPFEAMNVSEIKVSDGNEKKLLTDQLNALRSPLGNLNPRAMTKTQDHLTRLADMDQPLQPGQSQFAVMKCGFVPNALDFKDMALNDRVALVKSDTLPQSLGSIMVLGRLLGLGDHVGLSAIHNSDYKEGYTNMSNLMFNQVTGKVVLIDYDFLPDNRPNGASGFNEKSLNDGFQALSDFANQKLGQGDLTANLLALAKKTGLTPIHELMRAVFEPSVDSMFQPSEVGITKAFTDEEKAKFAANAVLGALDAMQLIADNPTAFTNGTPNFDNPLGVVGNVVQLAPGLAQIRADLLNYVQTH